MTAAARIPHYLRTRHDQCSYRNVTSNDATARLRTVNYKTGQEEVVLSYLKHYRGIRMEIEESHEKYPSGQPLSRCAALQTDASTLFHLSYREES
jgi:hypothetical protein